MTNNKEFTRREMLEAALWWAEQGYSPWPCAPSEKRPLNVGDQTWGGKRHVPLTIEQIEKVFDKSKRLPDLVLVILTDHFVIDLDPKNNPLVVRLFDDLRRVTRCVNTPSGGLHAYFRLPPGESAPTIDPALGVDVQGSYSLVIAPPSTGRTWANDLPEAIWEGGFSL